MRAANRYEAILSDVFLKRYRKGDREVLFTRDDIGETARSLGIAIPRNLGDLIYSFRYRATLPLSVRSCAPVGEEWVIRPAGRGRYKFEAVKMAVITPDLKLARTKLPDATPGIIARYALGDEQALLAKLRYNRLLDIFTRVTCYSLQSHLRTTVPNVGQVETDELYVGIDRRGAHYVFPVQAKGSSEALSVVQIEQDIGVCASKFPSLLCRPIAAQFLDRETIVMFALEKTAGGVAVVLEKHYQMVPPKELSERDLETYKARPLGDD